MEKKLKVEQYRMPIKEEDTGYVIMGRILMLLPAKCNILTMGLSVDGIHGGIAIDKGWPALYVLSDLSVGFEGELRYFILAKFGQPFKKKAGYSYPYVGIFPLPLKAEKQIIYVFEERENKVGEEE